MAVVAAWDGQARRIYLAQGVSSYHPIDDVYAEYRDKRRTDEAFRKWAPFMRAEGNVPKGGGKNTPRYLVLLGGVKVVPYDESAILTQLGDMITDNPDVDPEVYDMTTITQAMKVFVTPSESEVILVPYRDAIEEHLSYGGVVYVDSANGVSGTQYPKGTVANPINNIPDAKTVADRYGIKSYKIRGMTVLSLPHEHWTIEGIGSVLSDVVVMTGQSTAGTKVTKCSVTGEANGVGQQYETCFMSEVTGADCLLLDCALSGKLQVAARSGAQILAQRLTAVVNSEIDVNGDGHLVQATLEGGDFLLTNAGAGSVFQSRISNMGRVTIADSNEVGSVFSVEGTGTVTNNSLAATVLDTTFIPPTAQAVAAAVVENPKTLTVPRFLQIRTV